MKLISATCEQMESGGYRADVDVMSDSVKVHAHAHDENPQEATAQAIRNACREFENRVLNSAEVRIEIKF